MLSACCINAAGVFQLATLVVIHEHVGVGVGVVGERLNGT